ncbi:MAG: hypothetical protein QF689_13735 [Candidatus Latescibacteria bacterium]|jgi:hypothetical protein|nr:hypothetical protein [Gemmatimonadaceae bacterium]MDP6014474.1 hypothetical protein [Candidatus Latescibacterota bacterium]MDP7449648.1 hypothetical protein [Candidatus Latescibacterota bacterium]HJP31404.1 hypothetical protein [Candidatus Latescibacterota bacterium]|tara:strand:- start:257 stop:535 length:279 start_codon:yes stop_codon:yes gene_type:complete
MLHRQLRSALEEIFGEEFIDESLRHSELAQLVIHEHPQRFKEAVLGFQRLNFRDEQSEYAEKLQREFGYALICSLLHNPTREMVAELGLNYL